MHSTSKPGETFWLWLLKVASGVLLLVILGVHLIVNHFLAPNGLLSHAEVVAYFQNPLVVFMEGAFLLLVIIHSLSGLRSIFLDLNPTPGVLRALDLLLILFGAGTSAYGLWLLNAVRTF